jgi:hypothetical protein
MSHYVNRYCPKYQEFYCQTAFNLNRELLFKDNEIAALVDENRLLRQQIDISKQLELKRINSYSLFSHHFESSFNQKIQILERFLSASYEAVFSSSCKVNLDLISLDDLTIMIKNIEKSINRGGMPHTKCSLCQNIDLKYDQFNNRNYNHQHQSDQFQSYIRKEMNSQLNNFIPTEIDKIKISLNDLPSKYPNEYEAEEPQSQEQANNIKFVQKENQEELKYRDSPTILKNSEQALEYDSYKPIEIPIVKNYSENEEKYLCPVYDKNTPNTKNMSKISKDRELITSSISSKLSFKSKIKDKSHNVMKRINMKSTPKVKQVIIYNENNISSTKCSNTNSDSNTKIRKSFKSNNNEEVFDKLSKKSSCCSHNYEYYYGNRKKFL